MDIVMHIIFGQETHLMRIRNINKTTHNNCINLTRNSRVRFLGLVIARAGYANR
jgi:hypothetical protein